jgi:hypothetical protein
MGATITIGLRTDVFRQPSQIQFMGHFQERPSVVAKQKLLAQLQKPGAWVKRPVDNNPLLVSHDPAEGFITALAAKDLWSNAENGVQFNTPVVKNGLIFGLSERDNLFCINGQTGKTTWTVPVAEAIGGGQPGAGGRMGGGGYGSIVDAGPVLLALTPKSQLIAFEPSDKEFKQLTKYKIADTDTYACPVVAGNRLFVKDSNSLTLWTIE